MWIVITNLHVYPSFNGGLTKLSNYIPLIYVDVITYPFPNSDDGFN